MAERGYTLGAVVKGDSPFKTWKDVIEYAKKEPGKFTYTTIGAATSPASTVGSAASIPANVTMAETS